MYKKGDVVRMRDDAIINLRYGIAGKKARIARVVEEGTRDFIISPYGIRVSEKLIENKIKDRP